MQELTAVVAEKIEAGCWSVSVRAEVSERWRMPDESGISLRCELMNLASGLAKEYGGVFLRSFVFMVDDTGSSGPLQVTCYPHTVHTMTGTLALAHTADRSWANFLVLDLARTPSAASLAIRTNDCLVEQRIENCEPGAIVELARTLKIRHCIIRCANVNDRLEEESCAEILRREGVDIVLCDSSAHFAGARRFAQALEDDDGVFGISGEDAIRLNTARPISYEIRRTTRPAFDLEEKALVNVLGERPVLFVLDHVISMLYGEDIHRYASRHLHSYGEVVVMGRETDKTWPQVERICETASAAGLGRHGILVAVGGGITLDLAGTAASLFRRGIGYLRVPTTLVGLVDVAVGIKHGINAFGRKNILGSFYPPLASVSDYSFLRTLPVAEIACGFAEIIKVALVRDEKLLEQIEQYGVQLIQSHFQAPPAAAREIALRAELLMMEELAHNLFESSLARLVDFGHTFSPAIETATGYRITHGESVALDSLLSTAIAANKGICERDLVHRLFNLLRHLQLPVWDREMPSAETLCVAIQDARRHRAGVLNLVVPSAAGAAVFLQDIGREDIQRGLDTMYELASKALLPVHHPRREPRYASACV